MNKINKYKYVTHAHKEYHISYVGHACHANYVSHANDLGVLGQA